MAVLVVPFRVMVHVLIMFPLCVMQFLANLLLFVSPVLPVFLHRLMEILLTSMPGSPIVLR